MIDGIYEYNTSKDSLYSGTLRVRIRETEKSLMFTVISSTFHDLPCQLDEMFEADKITVKKSCSEHCVHIGEHTNQWDSWVLIYPYRAGVPFMFKKVE